jgi:hypothetical protein
MLTQVFRQITEATARPDRALVEDALGVAALFLLLFVGLSIPGFA